MRKRFEFDDLFHGINDDFWWRPYATKHEHRRGNRVGWEPGEFSEDIYCGDPDGLRRLPPPPPPTSFRRL